jgi:hypothetical protein
MVRRIVWFVFVLLLASGSMKADVINESTVLTFSHSVALPGTTLPAGSYVFELASPVYNRDVVQILSADRKTVRFMGFTQTVDRPVKSGSDVLVTIGEAPRGESPRVIAWFPEDSLVGHRFVYVGIADGREATLAAREPDTRARFDGWPWGPNTRSQK